MNNNPKQHKERYASIDMLRGIAILAVVFYHFTSRYFEAYNTDQTPIITPGFPGWLGVDLFFVISGYCIAFTIAKAQSLSGFWSARLSRLQPAYMVSALLTFLVLWLFPMDGIYVEIKQLLGNLLWLNALPPISEHIDGVYWSLIVELKFYFYFGILWFFFKHPRRVLKVFSLLVITGIFTQEIGKELNQSEIATIINTHLFIYPYSGFFLFGICLFHTAIPRIEKVAYMILSVLAVLLSPRYEDTLFFSLAIFPLSFLFIYFKDKFHFKPLIFIGLISYSWYLIHQMIGYKIMDVMYDATNAGIIALISATLFTFILACMLHFGFEYRYRTQFFTLFKRIFKFIGFKS